MSKTSTAARCILGWLFALSLACAEVQAAGALAPDWSLASSSGRTIEFHRDARGAPSVLFFWASWCPHCGAALPYIDALHREFAARGVHFYAMNIWEDGDAVAYFARHDYHLPLFLAADLVAEDYGVQGTPAVIVVDRDLRIADLNIDGAAPEDIAAALRQYLDAALNQARTVTQQ